MTFRAATLVSPIVRTMPLRAIADGRNVTAPFLSDDEWTALAELAHARREALVLPCCAARAYLRTSRLGLRHFVHRARDPKVCGAAPETEAHLVLKAGTAAALAARGFTVTTEYAGADWRADVLAERADVRLAVEVQLSSQTWPETVARTDRYRRDGVKCLWLFGALRSHAPAREVPAFEVSVAAGRRSAAVRVGEVSLPLEDFFDALLARRIRFCARLRTARAQRIRTVVRAVHCPLCLTPSEVYALGGEMRSPCGLVLAPETWKPFDDRAGFGPPPEMFRGRRATAEWQGLEAHYVFARPRRMGEYRPKGSGIMIRPFTCPNCACRFDRSVLRRAFFAQPVVAQSERDVRLTAPLFEERPHWCYAPGGRFCG